MLGLIFKNKKKKLKKKNNLFVGFSEFWCVCDSLPCGAKFFNFQSDFSAENSRFVHKPRSTFLQTYKNFPLLHSECGFPPYPPNEGNTYILPYQLSQDISQL
jgi:hypothetical protein